MGERNQSVAREWLLSQLDPIPKPFTPEVNDAMKEIWKSRESAVGEHKAIVHAFESVREFRIVDDRFTPHYFEKQDRLKDLWNEVLHRVRALKDYVEKHQSLME